MAAILDGLTQALSSSVTAEIGKMVGLKPGLVAQGMGTVGPLVTIALANKAATPNGLADLMQLLPDDDTNVIAGDVVRLTRIRADTGAVSSVFGGGSGAIGSTLDRALGFRASALLSVAVPLVLGVIARIAADKKLDAQSIGNRLAIEASEFQRKGVTARLVREAIAAGREAADIRAKYSEGQWDSVRFAPVAAAHVVMMADQLAPVAVVQEIGVASEVIDDARNSVSPTSVLSLAFEDDFSVDELNRFVSGRTPADALATVRDAAEVVERNNPSDAPRFRRLVADVARKVASAAREGGAGGAGATRTSAADQALDDVRAALGDR